jgi:hypothetical protein
MSALCSYSDNARLANVIEHFATSPTAVPHVHRGKTAALTI